MHRLLGSFFTFVKSMQSKWKEVSIELMDESLKNIVAKSDYYDNFV